MLVGADQRKESVEVFLRLKDCRKSTRRCVMDYYPEVELQGWVGPVDDWVA